MQAYPEVPQLWYVTLGIIALALLITTVEIFPTTMPIWALFIALLLASLLAVPSGMLQAITNQQVALQVMHELVASDTSVTNMIFKCVTLAGTT